jgi:3-dehydroquinate dehydratase / shikimate dehydrogenase
MGEKGLMSRILCPKFGGYLTFGTLEHGKVSAPGQPTIRDLLDSFNFRQLGPDTKVFSIIGNPVGHSKLIHGNRTRLYLSRDLEKLTTPTRQCA